MPTDLDLEHDVQSAFSAFLDREPTCLCVDTDRGSDTWGCPQHSWPEGREGAL